PELRFNELNCHKQCSPCNTQLSGNIANYRPILLERIGLANLEFVEGPHEPKKYTCAELKEIETLYKSKLKQITAG
ncbi:MAG TPA: recombination protein NinG, partial [Flavobacteriales bacterium]|nr:recombination protein NinG [Flavobacteriales bacterium]